MKTKNTEYLSLLNVVAAISVVFLHTNGCFWAFSTARYWATANIIESVFYFAVPIFFMISGSTLLDYRQRYSTRRFFVKRCTKTVIPFVFWSLVGLLLAVTLLGSVKPADLSVTAVINGVLNNHYVRVYWFFLPLFGVYASIPLYAAVPKENRKAIYGYMVLAGFVLNSLVPYLIHVLGLGISWPLRVDAAASYLLFVPLGYLLNELDWKPRWRYTLYALGAASLLFYLVGTYLLSMKAGEVVSTLKGYVSPPVILYSSGLFVLAKQIGPRLMAGPVGRLVNWLKGYTFAIYLLHMLLISVIRHFIELNTLSIIYRLGMPFVVIPLCVGITWLVRKIPLVEKLLP